jgi:hypothetical protein
MAKTLKQTFDRVKKELRLPANVDFRVFDTTMGWPVNRKKVIRPLGLIGYLKSVDDSTRVGALLRDLEQRIGAQVGARIELWMAGHRVDGRRSIAGLR